jgi:hypothetical protein
MPGPGGRLQGRGLEVVVQTWAPRVVGRLRVEPTALVNVPRVADVFAFECLEAVGAWSGHLCNCEGTFPWRAELV